MQRFALMAAALVLAAFNLAQAGTAVVQGTLLSDRWVYPFAGTPGSEARGPVFLSPAPSPGAVFNRRDGEVALKFSLALPTSFTAQNLVVTSASLTFWGAKTDNWVPGTTNSLGRTAQIELFAAGFGPTYSEAAWTGSEAYEGANSVTYAQRDPYPRDLVSNIHDEDNVSSDTAWGTFEAQGYTPSAMTDAYPIVCRLNISNAAIQQELRSDLASGLSSWMITSTFDAAQPPAVSAYPRVLMSEAVGATAYGTRQQAPALRLYISTVSATGRGWSLYE